MKLPVHIQPGAKTNEIAGFRPDGSLKIKIKAPPTDGKANEALCAFLAKTLGLPKARVQILHGHTSPRKIVELVGLETLPDDFVKPVNP